MSAPNNRPFANSPRHLTLQHAQKVKDKNTNAPPVEIPGDIAGRLRKLENGQEMLYSFFGPSLLAGTHSITTTQTIKAKGENFKIPGSPGSPEHDPYTTQTFYVEAPHYVLPEGAVHSTFPPPGSQVFNNTLPHILFTDPYLPWERQMPKSSRSGHHIPWLALLVFSQDELRLDDALLNGKDSLFSGTSLAGKPIQLNPDFALNMPIADFKEVANCRTPVKTGTETKDANSNAIFVKRHLFDLLTQTFDYDGLEKSDQAKADVSRYEYLAHVRHSAAEGMAALGESEGLFSAVLSHRVGPFKSQEACRAIVHLVSIENWEEIERSTSTTVEKDYVALSSLYSWTYNVLPADALSIAASFTNIGKGVDVLRAPNSVLDAPELKTTSQGQRTRQRLKDGYTIIKYHTQTGDETTAITRGALTPTTPPGSLGDWSCLSYSGANLQIFDQEAGLMDLTYSMAWNLGRTMAIADRPFHTALANLRSKTVTEAFEEARRRKLGWKSMLESIPFLGAAIANLHKISNGDLGDPDPTSLPGRLNPPDQPAIDISFDDDEIQASFEEIAESKIRHLAGSRDKDGKIMYDMFNELNSPNSTDWMLVLSWIMDKMYLFCVPGHYLLLDPSWLPHESLRFFYIDPHWVEALIDGALSVANHIDRDDDRMRRVLKGAFNEYFQTIDRDLHYRPQVPRYGCFLRSHLVKDFPDLHITAAFPPTPPKDGEDRSARAPILRQERLADDTLLCLFDRVPGSDELHTLTFTQPAHQQYFTIGREIRDDGVTVDYKRLFTTKQPSQPPEPSDFHLGESELHFDGKSVTSTGVGVPFIWGANNEARFLNLPGFTADVLSKLDADQGVVGTGFLKDSPPTSALVGYELGCPIYQLGLVSEHTALADLPPDSGPRLFTMLNASPSRAATAGKSQPMTATLQSSALLQTEQPLASLARVTVPPHFPQVAESEHVLSDILPEVGGSPVAGSEGGLSDTGSEADQGSEQRTLTASLMRSLPAARGGDAGSPEFSWAIYSIDRIGRSSILTGKGKPQDLVFSVVRTSGADYTYEVEWIMISVPVGPKKNLQERKNLFKEYRGPGPVMLTNLRFNVLISLSPKEGYLDLTLVPRSTKNSVKVKGLAECSFVLPLVMVNDYDDDEVHVTVRHREHYQVGADPEGDFQVILRP